MSYRYTAIYHSPIAVLGISTEGGKLRHIDFLPQAREACKPADDFSREVIRQLEAYFKNPQFKFELAVDMKGTGFQKCVWDALTRIPSGKTLSYGELAVQLKTHARPIGGACSKNPIPIVIPCHRIVSADGGLGGYAGHISDEVLDMKPLDIKRWLLRHENATFS